MHYLEGELDNMSWFRHPIVSIVIDEVVHFLSNCRGHKHILN